HGPMSLASAVFLDRDGVLAQEIVIDGVARAPLLFTDFHLFDDAHTQVSRLVAAGLRCYVFTNQPEVARGLLPLSELDAMHRHLRDTIAVEDVRVCPHDDADACVCRKPKPGMLLDFASTFGINLERSFVVGDR